MVNNEYIVKKVFRKYFLLSVLSSIASPLGMMVDGIVIGNFLGEEAMAAAGLASPLYILLSAFSGIIASGSTSLCGQSIGKEQPEQVKRIFSTAMLCSAAIFLICIAVCWCVPEQVAHVLGARGSLLPLTTDYIRGLGAGLGLCVVHLALVEFAKLDGSPALGPISIAVMTAVNIALDLVCVLWLHNGLFGVASATSISFLAAVLVCCIHFLKPIHTLKLVKTQTPWRNIVALCKHGLPRAGNGICFAVTIAFINYRLLFLSGSVALAAFSIQNSVAMFVGATCLGAGSTTLLLSGIFYGEEDKKAMESVVKISLREGVLVTMLACALCFAFIHPIILLFGQENSAVSALAVTAISWKLIGLVIFTVNHVFVNYYQSTDNLVMANFVSVIEALPAQVIFVAVLPVYMGVNGVWASSALGGITTFLALTIAVACQNRGWPRTLKNYLLFPKPFGVEDSMQLNVSISNDLQEVTMASKQAHTFCEKHGIDAKRRCNLLFCVEEMAGNVVQYAFCDQKHHVMDIRIVKKGEQLIFRLRDDGKPFNPLHTPPEKKDAFDKPAGFHAIQGFSHSIDYRYTVGLNNLQIKL